jgi:Nucleotidyltransferase domain
VTGLSESVRAAEAASRLAGFLNGTHHRLRASRGARDGSARAVVEAFRYMRPSAGVAAQTLELGLDLWTPVGAEERRLRDSLDGCLATDGVLELVLFGSLARGSTTGFSDVDAVLVVDDSVAADRGALSRLRPSVLAAGRAVFAYQPMQHHGFLVVTPNLLKDPSGLGMPAAALSTTRSLFGVATSASVPLSMGDPGGRFQRLSGTLASIRTWPRHPWSLHRAIAMFELAPVLYLQATGRMSAKHTSFGLACSEFTDIWHPYDTLAAIRERWPRQARPMVRIASRVCRNPWFAVALWRRLPASPPREVVQLLTAECLRGLHVVVAAMSAKVAASHGVGQGPIGEGAMRAETSTFGNV